MAVDHLANFLEMLRDSGVLTREQLDQLSQDPSSRKLDPAALARRLVEQGWLSRFQAKLLIQGRGKELVLGSYRLLDRLGEGGMGQVFKAHHQAMNRVVALKVIRKERLAKAGAVQRFYREVQIAAKLAHPNIVLAFDAGQVGSTHYLAMEYVDGPDLARLVREQGPLPAGQACDFIRQAALGLQHAFERGLVHRDIKPSNLLVTWTASGGGRSQSEAALGESAAAARKGVVKVLDMGLARLEELSQPGNGLTREGQIVGTPDYLAPEQAMNSRTVDVRADLYSLGCTFFYLLTGETPFRATSLTEVLIKHQLGQPRSLEELRPDLAPAVCDIVHKLMAKRAEDRYQTPAELVEALEPLCREWNGSSATLEKKAEDRASGPWDTLADSRTPKGKAATDDDGGSLPSSRAVQQSILRKPAAVRGAANKRRTYALFGIGGLLHAAALVVLILVLTGRWKRAGEAPAPASRPRQVVHVEPKPPAPSPRLPAPPDPVNANPGRLPAQPASVPKPPRTSSGVPGTTIVKELRRFDGHRSGVNSVVFSPDGRWLLTGSGRMGKAGDKTVPVDSSVRLWDVATGQQLRLFAGHTHGVRSVAFSPDARQVLSAGGGRIKQGDALVAVDTAIRLWDVETGAELRRFEGHTQEVRSVAFAPNGLYALSCSGDNTVRLWDVATGKEVQGLEGDTGTPVGAVFSADGRLVLTACMDKTVRLWEGVTGLELRRYAGHTGGVRCVAYSPDERLILSGSTDGTIRLWDVANGDELCRMLGHHGAVAAVAFAPDNRHILSGGIDNTLRYWDGEDGQELYRFTGHTGWVDSVAVSPDGRLAASASQDKTVRLWDLSKPAPATVPSNKVPVVSAGSRILDGHSAGIREVAWSADGRQALSAGNDGTIRLWDVRSGKQLHEFKGHIGDVCCVAYSRAGRRALSGGADRTVRLWDVDSGQEMRRFDGHTMPVMAVALSRDGSRAASAGGGLLVKAGSTAVEDCGVRLWDVATGQEIRRFEGHSRTVRGLAFSPDGQRMLSACDDNTVRLWNVETGQMLRLLQGGNGTVRSVAFAPDGNRALSGGSDKLVRLWDLNNGQELRRFQGHTTPIGCVGFSPDGSRALSCGGAVEIKDGITTPSDCVVRLWEVETGRSLGRLEGHTEVVLSAGFSPDGRFVLSGGLDRSLRVWDVSSAVQPTVPVNPAPDKPAATPFAGHTKPVTCLAVRRDGRRLLTGSQDRTLRLWDLESGKELRRFEGHAGDVQCVAISPDGRLAVSGDLAGSVRSWDGETGQMQRTLGLGGAAACVALTADGRKVLVGSTDGLVHIWIIQGPGAGQVKSWPGTGGAVQSVTCSPDGKYVIYGSADGMLRLRETETWREPGPFLGRHSGPVLSVAFSADGRSVLSGGADRYVRLWNLSTGKDQRDARLAVKTLGCIAFSADGRFALTGGDDHTVRLWDVLTGRQPLRSFQGHADVVRSVALSPDGRYAIAAGNGIKVWDLAKPAP